MKNTRPLQRVRSVLQLCSVRLHVEQSHVVQGPVRITDPISALLCVTIDQPAEVTIAKAFRNTLQKS